MNSDQPKSKHYRPQRAFIPYLVLAAGLLFTFAVSYYLFQISNAENQARFRDSVQEIDAGIQGRIETYIALLRAGTGLFAVSHSVERNEFKSFVDRLELPKHYAGAQGIVFSIRLSPEEKNATVH